MKRFPTDAVVAIPMVLRIFLLFRAIKLNSRIFEDIASQSLGACRRSEIQFYVLFMSCILYCAYECPLSRRLPARRRAQQGENHVLVHLQGLHAGLPRHEPSHLLSCSEMDV